VHGKMGRNRSTTPLFNREAISLSGASLLYPVFQRGHGIKSSEARTSAAVMNSGAKKVRQTGTRHIDDPRRRNEGWPARRVFQIELRLEAHLWEHPVSFSATANVVTSRHSNEPRAIGLMNAPKISKSIFPCACFWRPVIHSSLGTGL
jgi:hypothetical protein